MMAKMASEVEPLLEFARRLQTAPTFRELFQITLDEVRRSLGYQTIWFAVKDDEDATEVRVVDALGAAGAAIDAGPRIPVEGDAMLEELFRLNSIVVVEDARTDPRTNKAIVEALQNRTIINIPLTILDRPFGVLGLGDRKSVV